MAICCFAIYANYPALSSNNMKAKPNQAKPSQVKSAGAEQHGAWSTDHGADHPDQCRSPRSPPDGGPRELH